MTTSGAVSSGVAGGVGAAGVDEALRSGLGVLSAFGQLEVVAQPVQHLGCKRPPVLLGVLGELLMQVSRESDCHRNAGTCSWHGFDGNRHTDSLADQVSYVYIWLQSVSIGANI